MFTFHYLKLLSCRYDGKIVTGNIILHSQYFYFMYIKLIVSLGGGGVRGSHVWVRIGLRGTREEGGGFYCGRSRQRERERERGEGWGVLCV